jgi:hypothetical protein
MGTRANVILSETYTYHDNAGKPAQRTSSIIYYRHYDGNPETVIPHLEKIIDWIRRGKIRRDVQQGGGWLFILGAVEYNTIPQFETEDAGSGLLYGNIDTLQDPRDWKAGAYEPTDGIHGDINFLYTLDMKTLTIKTEQVYYDNEDRQQFMVIQPHIQAKQATTAAGQEVTPEQGQNA